MNINVSLSNNELKLLNEILPKLIYNANHVDGEEIKVSGDTYRASCTLWNKVSSEIKKG